MQLNDTIVAIATPQGMGAIAVLRISGPQAFQITEKVFISKQKTSLFKHSHKVYFGNILDDDTLVDEVLITVFKGPHSYTGEDSVEISCHGSTHIQQELLKLLVKKGCRLAESGEFTMRAFLNKKLDLSQAEAVCDLITSKNQALQQLALKQIKGGISNEIQSLRQKLIDFVALMELELDFAEEDVNFADQNKFKELLNQINQKIKQLLESFTFGNAVKEGIPVVIIGKPNAGKSTLLNALLNEQKALVSNIPGTTRDAIEETLNIRDLQFRFIDTAGIRNTSDQVEKMGVARTFEKTETAQLILYLIDGVDYLAHPENYKKEHEKLKRQYPEKEIIKILTKEDLVYDQNPRENSLYISAMTGEGLSKLREQIYNHFNTAEIKDETILINTRHYEALIKVSNEVKKIYTGLKNQLPKDLLAMDVKEAIRLLGTVIGVVDMDKDILETIFGRFCIGK